MNLLKIVCAVILALVALTLFGKIRQKLAAGAPAAGSPAAAKTGANAKDPGLSAAGFFLLSRDGAKHSNVIIISAPNCPSEESARAQMLQSSLQSAGIPCEMQQGIEFQFTDPDDVARVTKYTGAGIVNPLVLVRGWAKGNPLAEDVIAQYSQNH